MEKIIKTLTGGYTCRYTDEGVTCIQDSGTKNTEIYFPYGSITKIKLGFLGLDIISADQSFYMPVSGKTKAEVKEMVAFIQNKMKNAKPEKATAVSATGRQSLSGNQHVTERKFYDACQKMNLALSESSPPADIQRAVLIAGQNNLKLSEKDVIIAYAIGKKEARHARRQHKFKELYDSGKELEKYLSYHGKEKEVMLTGKMLNYYKQQEEYICSGRAIPLQKEKDWAIMGGIASAIAGGVAGIAVASDIQRKNAEISAQNAAVSASYARAVIPALNKVREEISKWEKIYEKAKAYACDDSDPEELFKKISIKEEKVHILDDGNFVVTALAYIYDVTIHGKIKAQIDGSITAMVYQDGTLIGEAPVVLPRDVESLKKSFSTHRQTTIVGSSIRRCADPNKPCEVKFKCRDLWAIEKL